jgi:hypothetical protein
MVVHDSEEINKQNLNDISLRVSGEGNSTLNGADYNFMKVESS